MPERLILLIAALGRRFVGAVDEAGYLFALLVESVYWLLFGAFLKQPVRLRAIFSECMAVGVRAIPIVTIACFATGAMLAIQGVATLKLFGAESQVVLGITLSVTREFAPLIAGIFVAGRTSSAVAARIGTMQVSQEIDALRVLGINPVRYLVSPLLAALLITLPMLTVLANFTALLGGAFYCSLSLNLPVQIFFERAAATLEVADVMQGMIKSSVFAVNIALVGACNGFKVTAGAEGVGRATTRSVVLSIVYIILIDAVFTYFMNR
ncbi:MAG: ABC-type transporter, permease component [Proteobacteria bacterium]|nr:ABC-type transporter, permease component [Pseudomonadota bacterium]